jgi:hypothetical protein
VAVKSKNYLISILILFSSCISSDELVSSYSEKIVESGDIVVANYGNSSVVLLDSDGVFKRVLLALPKNAENTYGMSYSNVTNEILVSVDGADRIVAISTEDISTRTFASNIAIGGTMRGISELDNGDVIIVESNNVERVTNAGERVTSGWPINSIQSNPAQVFGLDTGGFVLCSTGTDVVRTYNDAGAQQNEATKPAGTSNAYGCAELADGNLVGAWDGTTDTIVVYGPTLGAVASYSDTTVISTPRAVAPLANGNFLVADSTRDYLVELDSSANFVRIIGHAGLSDPQGIIEIP